MSQILEKILSEKASEVSSLKKNNSLSNLEKIGHGFKRRGFEKILFNFRTQKKLAVIAEIKKASPSNGQFKTDFDVEEISISYESNGAACISVLTDKKFFMGSLENLALARNKVQLPVLRKDFIIDPIQVAESFAIGSDCILLIASALSQDKLLELESQAKTYGMDCLLEVHNEQDLIKVLNCKSKLVGINNRNLNDFNVDIATTERLLKEVPTDKLVVSESGINGKAEVEYLEKIGVTSYLIGELLMKNKSPGLALKKLLMSCDKTIDIRSNEE